MLSTLVARFKRLPPTCRIAAAALGVAAAYYVGANLGYILRLPPSVPSVVWPPNSILTATLLVVPRRRWWVYLLAVFPAHLAAELPAWPAPMVLAWFLTNCSEAVIAALFVQHFSDASARLDTLLRVVVFIVGAALLAPFLSSFADAWAVVSLRGEPFWTVWQMRLSSNVLTELAVVPAILTTVCWLQERAGSSTRRRVEAAMLATLLLASAIFVFVAEKADLEAMTGRTPIASLLPCLLWAAARFGPLGASWSLLTVTLVGTWAATHSLGPFTTGPVNDHVLSLQSFLTVVAIPLLCLSALVEERRRVESALAERLRFEKFVARLSAAFVHVPSDEIDRAIAAGFRSLGEFLEVDRVILLQFAPDSRHLEVAQSWVAPACDREPHTVVGRDFPAAADRLVEEKPFVFSRNGVSPAIDVCSSLVVPIVGRGRVHGGLELDSVASDRTWPPELVERLRLVAEVFGNVLARREAEDALRASELMKSAILSSLSSGVAVVDREGRVVAVNDSWSRLREDPRSTPYGGAAVGADYLELCREALRQRIPHAREMLAGTEEVVNGARDSFAFEYSSPPAKAERWFVVSVVPLNRREGGAVVSHTEVTERKRAEVQAQRSRQELAHVARVSAMGELTASLAHELRQPLTGIMTNAQAGRRLLRAAAPDVDEVRTALDDIIADTRRAADAIQRLRDVLRKSDVLHSRVDLNELVAGVTRLLGSDAIIRSVTMSLELATSPALVSGDRVQLEQVILNVLMNAMDAMADLPDEERTVVVRTDIADSRVHVAFEDTGPGLRDETRERVFEPFFTTKPAGMGMGLSIARSIIEAHGGTIWATNNPGRGVTFHFSLPKVQEAAV